MAFAVADSVWESSTDSGSTASYNMLGALVGYKTFFSTIGTGNTCYYAIVNRSVTTEWEIGLGTISGTSGTGILTRTTILSSSTGSLVNFSAGVKDIFCTYPASTSVYLDEFSNLALDASNDFIVGTSNLPQIKPSLNLDFANGKQLDPRITFSRNTVATYYDGKSVAKAEENLLTYSQDFMKWNSTGAYTGMLGAELLSWSDLSTQNPTYSGNYNSSATHIWDTGAGTISVLTAVNYYYGFHSISIANLLTVGKTYIITAVVASSTGDGGYAPFITVMKDYAASSVMGATNRFVTSTTPQTISVQFTYAISTAPQIWLYAGGQSTTTVYDSISIKEVIMSAQLAPDNTSSANVFVAQNSNGILSQIYTANASQYIFSVWLKRKTGTGVVQIAADNSTYTNVTLTSNWERFNALQNVTAGSKSVAVKVTTAGDEVYLWGAQLEQRSSVTAYTPTTSSPITNYIPVLKTAPANVPRFDYDPITKKPLGLLIEEGRTNLMAYSSDFSNAAWVKTNVTITSVANVAPDGTQTTQNIIPSKVVGGANYPFLSQPFSATSGVTYIISAYVKYNGVRYIAFRTYGTNFVWFDVLSGTVANNSNPSLFTPFVTSVGNGWYRVGYSVLAITTGSMNHHVYLTDNSATVSWSGAANGYSGIYIWGAQLEAGSFATSYIPTTTTAVSRPADQASMTGTNFSSWYNQSQGTMYVEWDYNNAAAKNLNVVPVGMGVSGNNRWMMQSGSVPIGPQKGAVYVLNSPTFGLTQAVFLNGMAGGLYGANYADTTPINNLRLGSAGSFALPLTGHIRKLSYYPKALTAVELQGLTS